MVDSLRSLDRWRGRFGQEQAWNVNTQETARCQAYVQTFLEGALQSECTREGVNVEVMFPQICQG